MVREVREFFDGPIALSGSISEGSSVLSAQALGADYAYIGTRFIATKEANASPGYKQMIVDSAANDIMYSPTFTGVHGNYLKPSVVNAGLDPDNLPHADKNDMNFGSSGLSGDNSKKAWKDIWGCGQGIGAIKNVLTCNNLVDKLKSEYIEAKNRLNKIYNKDNLYKLLKLAVENIIVIQNESNLNNLKNLKEYTFEDLKIELKEFVTYYIPKNKNSNFPTSKFYETWKSIFYSQNYNMKNFVHKDFEFVNLFFLENCESHLQCGIIDFQSAFIGFIGWDLLSLLENPRINFTRDYNDKLIEYFYDNTSIIENFNTFLEQYYVLSLARQTRLLGRWRKLLSKNNDNKYLNYLKITKSRTIATLNNIKNYELRSIYEKYL